MQGRPGIIIHTSCTLLTTQAYYRHMLIHYNIDYDTKYIVVFNYFIFYLPFRITKLMKEDMGKTTQKWGEFFWLKGLVRCGRI